MVVASYWQSINARARMFSVRQDLSDEFNHMDTYSESLYHRSLVCLWNQLVNWRILCTGTNCFLHILGVAKIQEWVHWRGAQMFSWRKKGQWSLTEVVCGERRWINQRKDAEVVNCHEGWEVELRFIDAGKWGINLAGMREAEGGQLTARSRLTIGCGHPWRYQSKRKPKVWWMTLPSAGFGTGIATLCSWEISLSLFFFCSCLLLLMKRLKVLIDPGHFELGKKKRLNGGEWTCFSRSSRWFTS